MLTFTMNWIVQMSDYAHYYMIGIVTLIIIFIQAREFSITLRKLKGFSAIFPGRDYYRIVKPIFTEAALTNSSTENLESLIDSHIHQEFTEYALDFNEPVPVGTRKRVLSHSGVYIVCEESEPENKKILYIGESEDIRKDVIDHRDYNNWLNTKSNGSNVYVYPAENVKDNDRDRIVQTLRVVLGQQDGDSFVYPRTRVRVKGIGNLLPDECLAGTEGDKEIALVRSETINRTLLNIVKKINAYLFRNYGSVSDFSLIKDIVERNLEAEEDEINSRLPVPLYLGLMGTMIGIIIGVGFMTILGLKSIIEGEDKGYQILLGGVAIAMTSSFVGLLLTVISTVRFNSRIKRESQSSKNEFYAWLQEEILPVLSKDLASGMYSLQANLNQFNRSFSHNVEGFSSAFSSIEPILHEQANFVSQLKDIDVTAVAAANIEVLKQIKENVGQIKDFGDSLKSLAIVLENTERLNDKINHQLDRTSELRQLVKGIETYLKLSEKLIETINPISEEIADRKLMLQKGITSIDVSILELIDGFRQNYVGHLADFQRTTSEFSAAVTRSIDVLHQEIKESYSSFSVFAKEEPDRLKSIIQELPELLGKLNQLEEIKSSILTLSEINRDQSVRLQALTATVSSIIPNITKSHFSKGLKRMSYAFMIAGSIASLGIISMLVIMFIREFF